MVNRLSFTLKSALAGLALAAVTALPSVSVAESMRVQLGTLVCDSDGGWGAVITSKKEFDCTFSQKDGTVKGRYKGVIRKYGIDLGKTGETSLVWLVLGGEETTDGKYTPGSLAGEYAGVGGEATLGVGVGANAMIGGQNKSFVLQPISVQVQTGLSLAAAVETLKLTYEGPIQ